MHTLDHLTATDFHYRSSGRAVGRDEVLPAIDLQDRLGIVMGTGAEGLGAANFLLSCVIAFYDRLGERQDEFFEYPDYYTFQATTDPADYRMFDVYPGHKNVSVAGDAEAMVRAVNDRGITTLLVPDRPRMEPEIEDVTRRSAERTIEQAFLYSPTGHLEGEGFEISLPLHTVEDWFQTTVDSMTDPPSDGRALTERGQQDRISQGYRRVPLEETLERIPEVAQG